MSKIIEKTFNAGKKIIRSIFLGTPNLITSSDLNRQIEAFKYQLDKLDEKTGFLSDITITPKLSSGTLTITYNYSYLEFMGCSFTPPKISVNTNLTQSAPKAYLCLVAEKETLTYDTDSSHEIAGAKFSDGTSFPAANQLIYKNESVVLSHSVSSVENFVGILAIIELTNSGSLVLRTNTIEKNTSLSLGEAPFITELSSTSGDIAVGDTYDIAFSKIKNKLSGITTSLEETKDTTKTLSSRVTVLENKEVTQTSKVFSTTARTTSSSSATVETTKEARDYIKVGDIVEFYAAFEVNTVQQTIRESLVIVQDGDGYAEIRGNIPILFEYSVADAKVTTLYFGIAVATGSISMSFNTSDSSLPLKINSASTYCIIHRKG